MFQNLKLVFKLYFKEVMQDNKYNAKKYIYLSVR